MRDQDGDKALSALQAQEESARLDVGTKLRDEALNAHQAIMENPLTREFGRAFEGKDYGRLAGGDLILAETLHMADIGRQLAKHLPGWEKALRADIDKEWEKKIAGEVRPAIEREMTAKSASTIPRPDVGSGGNVGVLNDSDFLVAFGRGEVTDWARARALTGIH